MAELRVVFDIVGENAYTTANEASVCLAQNWAMTKCTACRAYSVKCRPPPGATSYCLVLLDAHRQEGGSSWWLLPRRDVEVGADELQRALTLKTLSLRGRRAVRAAHDLFRDTYFLTQTTSISALYNETTSTAAFTTPFAQQKHMTYAQQQQQMPYAQQQLAYAQQQQLTYAQQQLAYAQQQHVYTAQPDYVRSPAASSGGGSRCVDPPCQSSEDGEVFETTQGYEGCYAEHYMRVRQLLEKSVYGVVPASILAVGETPPTWLHVWKVFDAALRGTAADESKVRWQVAASDAVCAAYCDVFPQLYTASAVRIYTEDAHAWRATGCGTVLHGGSSAVQDVLAHVQDGHMRPSAAAAKLRWVLQTHTFRP